MKGKINYLVFSGSPRKLWVNSTKRILNPSYWLLGKLAERLSVDRNVYYIEESVERAGEMKPWSGEKIDKVIILGVSYMPSSLTGSFKEGNPRHQRAFDIADQTKFIMERDKPEVIEWSVDVRCWDDVEGATETFGMKPDVIMTEQDFGWHAVGYLFNNKKYNSEAMFPKKDYFGFAGGAKLRYDRFKELFPGFNKLAYIHGGGWEKHLGHLDNVFLEGFQQFNDSYYMLSRAKWGLTLHEPVGNEAGWITAKLFEYFGLQTVTFVDSMYDKNEMYVPKNNILRVDSSEEISEKIKTLGYEKLLKEQNKLINPIWGDFEKFYYEPVIKFLSKNE